MPQLITPSKKHGNAVLFYFLIMCWNCREGTLLQGAFCKKPLKNPQKLSLKRTTLFLRKLLGFQRTFLEKPFVSGFGADAPTFHAHKKTRHCRVFYFTPISFLKKGILFIISKDRSVSAKLPKMIVITCKKILFIAFNE